MRQPERDVVEAAEAAKFEALVRRAIEQNDASDAVTALLALQALARQSASRLVVTTYLLGVVRAAALIGGPRSGALISLARNVVDIVEPWFTRPLDDFSEVAEGGRHAALHALMHVAAEAREIDDAQTIRALDHAGNLRAVRRWAAEGIASSPGCHAHYPNAYGTAQLIGHCLEKGRFDLVAAQLDKLEAITALGDTVETDTLDACMEEEAGALLAVLASPGAERLWPRCEARRNAIAAMAGDGGRFPRLAARLASAD